MTYIPDNDIKILKKALDQVENEGVYNSLHELIVVLKQDFPKEDTQ
jgi:hypothetical protein